MEKDRILLDYNPPTTAEWNAQVARISRQANIFLIIVAVVVCTILGVVTYVRTTQ